MRNRILLLLACFALAGCSLFRVRPPTYDAVVLPSGLVVRDIVIPDEGPEVAPGDSVGVHFELRLEDQTLIESSRDSGSMLHFQVGAGTVLLGLEEGVIGMRQFGRRRLTVPSELGFGVEGRPPLVPPDARLVVDVELLEHEPAQP